MDEDRSKPLSIEEIKAETKPQKDRPPMHRGVPIGCGDTGISLGKPGRNGLERPRHYDRDETESVPDGETVGARTIK